MTDHESIDLEIQGEVAESIVSAAYAQGVIDERSRILQVIDDLPSDKPWDLYGFEYKNRLLSLLMQDSEVDDEQ